MEQTNQTKQEKIKACKKAWRLSHPEYAKNYYQEHKEKMIKQIMKNAKENNYYQRNKIKINEQLKQKRHLKKLTEQNTQPKLIKELIAVLGENSEINNKFTVHFYADEEEYEKSRN